MSTAVVEPITIHAPTRPLEVLPGFRQVALGHVTIVSIYPEARFKRLNHNGLVTYVLPAAPRGSYSKLVVYDTQQWIWNPNPSNNIGEPRGEFKAGPIPARVVADSLVTAWASDTLGHRSGYRPGIATIAGDEPTPEELQALRESQSALFDWYITDAHDKFTRGEKNEISAVARLAAREMLGNGAEQLPWFPKVTWDDVKDCPSCGMQILKKALRCKHCTEKLPQFYIECGYDPTDDPVVLEAINRIRAARAAGATEVAAEPEQAKPATKSHEPRLVKQ